MSAANNENNLYYPGSTPDIHNAFYEGLVTAWEAARFLLADGDEYATDAEIARYCKGDVSTWSVSDVLQYAADIKDDRAKGIKSGDEVKAKDILYVVTRITATGMVEGITPIGDVKICRMDEVYKTGRHFATLDEYVQLHD